MNTIPLFQLSIQIAAIQAMPRSSNFVARDPAIADIGCKEPLLSLLQSLLTDPNQVAVGETILLEPVHSLV
jgi:hypothetical protein